MDNIRELISDPYKNTDISIVTLSVHYDKFAELHDNLLSSSPNFNNVELMVKIDDDNENASKYFELLGKSKFKFKILVYPKFNKILSNHVAWDYLYRMSSGKLIFLMGEDFRIVHGDWYKSISKFINYDKYSDNIYTVMLPMDNGKGYKQICGAYVVTREWCEVLNSISATPNVDRWIYEVSKSVGRCLHFEESELLSHYPKGRRTLSKQQRKDVFYPMLKEAVKAFKSKIDGEKKCDVN
jgi:hypothetical protein